MKSVMVTLRLKYVVEDVDRHGNVRIYFRRPGFPKIRLRGLPGSHEFQEAYAAALAKTQAEQAPRKTMLAERGSLEWLCLNYYRSADFRHLDVPHSASAPSYPRRTMQTRRRTLALQQADTLEHPQMA